MEHQGTKTIETERLILRKFTADDLSAIFHNWTSDEKVTEFLRWPTHKSIDITKRVLESWLLEYEKPDFYQWAIIPKEIGEPIGTISVIELNEKTEKVHIGYCLGSRWWHCGFTSEAFTAVIAFLFEEVKVNRIETWHDPQNPNSGKVMQKCGLIYEGTLRQADWNNKGIVDACVYGILASDYRANKKESKKEDAPHTVHLPSLTLLYDLYPSGFADCHLQESSHISSIPRSATHPSSSFAFVASQ